MAYQLNYFSTSLTAGTDLSTVTGPVFIATDATNRAVVCDQTTAPLGILENSPPLANVAAVSYLGITKVTVDAQYSAGTFLKSNASGVGTTDSTGINGTLCRAITLEDSTAANDIVAVRLVN